MTLHVRCWRTSNHYYILVSLQRYVLCRLFYVILSKSLWLFHLTSVKYVSHQSIVAFKMLRVCNNFTKKTILGATFLFLRQTFSLCFSKTKPINNRRAEYLVIRSSYFIHLLVRWLMPFWAKLVCFKLLENYIMQTNNHKIVDYDLVLDAPTWWMIILELMRSHCRTLNSIRTGFILIRYIETCVDLMLLVLCKYR